MIKRKEKKDLLIMCQYFYPEKMTSALLPFMTAEYLVNSDLTVDVLTGKQSSYFDVGENTLKYEKLNGINIKRLSYLSLSKKGFISRLINYFSIVFAFFVHIPMLKDYKILMVYSNPPILPLIPVLAKKIFKNKIVFVSYDVYPEIAIKTEIISKNSIIARTMRGVNKLLFANVEKVVALSNEMKEFLLKNRNIEANKIEVIPNWAVEPKAQNISIENGKFSIGYFGNIGIAQDFDVIKKIIYIFKDSESIEWYFAGHGNSYEKFLDYIDSKKILNVKLVGYLNEKDLAKLASTCNCFVLSLKENLNGLAVPSKFYTYLNFEKPIISIISQDSDIAKETKKYHLGYSVSNNDIDGFVKAINNIQREMRLNCKNNQSNCYDSMHQLSKYEYMIKEILGK